MPGDYVLPLQPGTPAFIRVDNAMRKVREARTFHAILRAVDELQQLVMTYTGRALTRIDLPWRDRDALLARVERDLGHVCTAHEPVSIAGVLIGSEEHGDQW